MDKLNLFIGLKLTESDNNLKLLQPIRCNNIDDAVRYFKDNSNLNIMEFKYGKKLYNVNNNEIIYIIEEQYLINYFNDLSSIV